MHAGVARGVGVGGSRAHGGIGRLLGAACGLFLLLLVPAGARASDEEAAPPVEDAPPAAPGAGWTNSTTGLEVRGLAGLRAHPKDEAVLYAQVLGLGLAVSRDRGLTWTPLGGGLKPATSLRAPARITVDEREPDTIYAVVDGHVYRSTDAGTTFTEITSGALATNTWDRTASAHLAYEVVVDPRKSLQLLVGTYNDGRHHGGLFESADGGRSWEQIAGSNLEGTGLGHDTFWIRRDPKTEKNVFVAGRSGAWYSDDRGRKFEPNAPGGEGLREIRHVSEYLQAGRDLYLADSAGLWRSKDAGRKWAKEPILTADVLFVAQDPHNQRRLRVITRDRGVLEGDESGREWRPLGGAAEGAAAGYGLALAREILAHPRTKKRVFLASPETGLHLSTDDGATFTPVAPDALPAHPAAIVNVAVGPTGVHLALSAAGRVYRSTDDGRTFEAVGVLTTGPDVLVAGRLPGEWWVGGRRLLRSTDDGATWTQAYASEDGAERIAAVVPGPEAEVRVLLARGGAVATSKDRGATWTLSPEPRIPAATYATALAVDPSAPDHWLVALRSLVLPWAPADPNGGVLETFDAGKTWKRVDEGLRPGRGEKPEQILARRGWNHGRLVVIDPAAGLLLYGSDAMGLFGRVLLRPDAPKPDQPPTWVRLAGLGLVERLRGFELETWAWQPGAGEASGRLALGFVNPADERREVWVARADGLRALLDHRLRPPPAGAEEDPEPEPQPFSVLPEAPAIPASLGFDPGVEGRLVGGDARGTRGVLAYTPEGATPRAVPGATEEPGPEEGSDGPAPDGTAAPAPPVGLRVVSTGADGTVRDFDPAAGGDPRALAGHQGGVRAVVRLPGGGLATAGEDRTVRRWSGDPWASAEPYDTGARVNALLAGPDALYAGLEEAQAIVALPHGPGEARTFQGHSGGVRALAQGLDPARLYSGGADQTVKVWDTQTGMEVLSIPAGGVVTALAVSPDGARIVAAVEGFGLKAFDASGAPAGQLEMGTGAVNALAMSPDGATLYAASTGVIGAIDAQALAPRALFLGPTAAVTCLGASLDGGWLAAGDADGGLWLYAVGEQDPRWRRAGAHAAAVHGVALLGAPARSEAPPPEAPPGGAPPEGGAAPDGGAPPGGGAAPEGGSGPDKPAPEGPPPGPQDPAKSAPGGGS